MPVLSFVFRVFVASPSDCAAERRLVRDIASEWNAIYSLSERVIVEPVFWESHSRPDLGDRAQALINKQLLGDCDIGIGVFWTRLGTPTGDSESGSVEEIDELRKAGRPVLLYFSAVPIEPDSVDQKEYQRLKAFRTRMEAEGLYFRYHDLSEFRKLLERHLAQHLTTLIAKARAQEPTTGPFNTGAVGQTSRVPFGGALDSYRAALRKLISEWTAERDSEPLGVDEGKRILASAAREASQLRSFLDDDSGRAAQTLDSVARKARQIQNHRLSIDGGTSFRAFWDGGDEILNEMKTVPGMLIADR